MHRRHAVVVFAVGGALLVVGGAVAFAVSPPVTFGWFAYSPLSEQSFPGRLTGAVVLSHQQLLGAGATVLGAFLLAGTAGYAWGQRRPARPQAEASA